MVQPLRFIAIVLGLALASVACQDNVVGPENEPEVSNATDTFQWQVSNLESVTQTFTYEWQNTGVTADVDQSSSVTGGTALLRIRDAGGTQVYTHTLTEGGTFESDPGDPGEWTIEVRLTDVTGTLNFRVQKP
jgi:hypothetical protein